MKKQIDYSNYEIEIANKTSRSKGAIGANAITPKYVKNTSKNNEKILDFGAGKNAIHALNLKQCGFDVVAYEFGNNIDEKIHDKNALNKKYDTVYASNVLNVQSTEEMLEKTLNQIKNVVKKNGRFVFNFPETPRKGYVSYLSIDEIIQKVNYHFRSIKKVGGSKNSPLFEAKK